MAHRAIRRQPQPHPTRGLHALPRIQGQIFLGNRAALIRRDVATVKSRGHKLIRSRMRQKIASHLINGELIKRLVVVKRIDDPVAIGPDFPIVVEMKSMRVSIPRGIQPVTTAMFAPLRPRHPGGDQFFISIRTSIRHEGLHLCRIRRQPRKIQGKPSRQRMPIRLRSGFQSVGLQLLQHKGIDGISHQPGMHHAGNRRALGLDQGPMRQPVGPLIDP